MYIGSHVSFDSKEQLLKSVKESISYGGNTFMFYTGAPQNTRRCVIDDELTFLAFNLMKENNIDLDKVICHAPYIVNLANDLDPEKYDFSIKFLRHEIERLERSKSKILDLIVKELINEDDFKKQSDEIVSNIHKLENEISELETKSKSILTNYKYLEEVRKKAIGDDTVIECRTADLIEPELEKYREETKDFAKSEEDVLSYALFPQVAKKFFETRDNAPAPAAEESKERVLYVEDLS